MKFSVQLTIDKEASSRSFLVEDLFSDINDFLKGRKYGEGIYHYFISLYVINPPAGYEHLHKDFKPKFIDHKVLTNTFTGEKLEIRKQFHYSIRIAGDAFSRFVNLPEIESKKLLATEIFKSLSHLEKLPKKVKDFDKDRFIADLESYFKEHELI